MHRAVRRPRWALILTPPDHRKTDQVVTVAELLTSRGVRVAGFAQRRRLDATRHYELHCLTVDEAPVPIARRGGQAGPGDQPFCNCVFRSDAFAIARAWLARDLPDCDVAVIDEVSRLEASGGGHAIAVAEALARAPLTVLSIRADRLAVLMDRFGLDEPVAVLESDDSPLPFVDAVVDCFRVAPTLAAHVYLPPSLTETF